MTQPLCLSSGPHSGKPDLAGDVRAYFLVHWPGRPLTMCMLCAQRAFGIARAAGFGLHASVLEGAGTNVRVSVHLDGDELDVRDIAGKRVDTSGPASVLGTPCRECGRLAGECIAMWLSGRKCCPDCTCAGEQ
ncbi:MAG TPA: hypothetical protein VM756_10580 [Burkholderiales bacterium]|nr:hypothetical protein [Burkholderiales bacterium]